MRILKKQSLFPAINVPIYLCDVAEIKIGRKFRREAAGHNGQEAVYVTVQKQYGGDTLSTIKNIKKVLNQISRDLPPGIEVKTIYDQSTLIQKSIGHLEASIIEGILLIVLIMIVFMGDFKGALIASLTIPFSNLFALIAMALFKIKLTVMSIGGLAIGIGKMANGSIIMVENILRLLKERKEKEVGKYLFSASLIIIFVFVPLLSLTGLEGAMFRPTAFAVAASLLGAMLLNLTLQPVLATYFMGKYKESKKGRKLIIDFIQAKYEIWLRQVMRHKKVLFTIFCLLIIGAVISYHFLGKEFVPPLDEGSIIVSTVMLPETSLEASDEMARK